MDYVLDSYAILYLLESFPKKLMEEVWLSFLKACNEDVCISDREALNELEYLLTEVDSLEWIKEYRSIFKPLKEKEAVELGNMMQKNEFSFYDNAPEHMRKMPIASPFIVAKAFAQKKVLVIHKSNRYKNYIEKLCKKHKVKVMDVEDFLLELK